MITLVQKSIATLIREAATAQGATLEHQYSTDGRNGYVINGRWLTPGEACKLLNIVWGS